MTRIAIHQPNYAPWLGYFHKIAQADAFIFLDDAQFSKGSYTNRVQILAHGRARWLTVPVSHALDDPIDRVALARPDWAASHLDTLRTCYEGAARFASVWDEVRALYDGLPAGDLAAMNRVLVERFAARLGLATNFLAASALGANGAAGDDRLIALVQSVEAHGTYLSGRGGAKYQDPAKFAAAGLGFEYSDFTPSSYDQGGDMFVSGLSVLDAVFHLGWDQTARLVRA